MFNEVTFTLPTFNPFRHRKDNHLTSAFLTNNGCLAQNIAFA